MLTLQPLCALSDEEVPRVHEAALAILERTGARFADPRARDLLAERGARIEGERVLFPPEFVAEVLARVRPEFTLTSRRLGREVRVGRPEVLFSNSTYDVFVLDTATGERRRSRLEDTLRFIQLEDALESFDLVGGQVVPQDVPLPMQQIRVAEALLKGTGKPITINTFNARECRTILEMATVVAGGSERLRRAPNLVMLTCPDSPLRYEVPVTDAMRLAAARGVPVAVSLCPILGASSPVTLAGTLAQTLAEALAGIAFVKCVDPDAPVYTGTTAFVMAPHGNLLMGAPESYLVAWGLARMCEHLGIPNTFSCTHTDSKLPTIQSGYEKAMGLMLAISSGSPMVQVPAILDDGATTALEQVVLEAEMVGAAKRVRRGIGISDETLALPLIDTCARGESYLSQEHTVSHLRSELWQPQVFFRGTWEEAHPEGALAAARERVADLLARPTPPALSEDAARELERMAAHAEREALG